MRWMVLILGLSLSGCVIAPYDARYQQPRYQEGPPPLQSTSMAQVNAMVGAQQPAAYKVGFMEGCDSGRLSAGETSYIFKKDTDRFNTDDAYKQGWNDGHSRCASGAGVTASNNYSYPTSNYGYDYYYPRTFYSGFYGPSYYYSPGYSIWLGYYGYPRHRHYVHRHNYYYTHWSGGHSHWGGRHYSGRSGHRVYRGGSYIRKHRGPGKIYKGWGHKKRRGRKGGGHKGGGRAWKR